MDEKLLPLKEFIVKIIHADKGPMRTIDLYDSSAIANAIVAELNRRAEQPQGEKIEDVSNNLKCPACKYPLTIFLSMAK
jgi:hypothetical protein